jgi:hypothetical protein
MRHPVHRHLALLHGLQERSLGLGRRPVDLVRQEQVGEDRPRTELEAGRAGIEDRGAGDVGRHEVGRELDSLEVEIQHLRE